LSEKNILRVPATEAVDAIAYEDIGKLMLAGMKKVRERRG
jgi:hypothetical protein